MSEFDDLDEGQEYEEFGDYCYKPVAMFVADFESGECDMLWSDDVDQMDSLLACDILKDAIGMLERKYKKAYERLDTHPVIAAAMNIPPPKDTDK
jgi:hypothetical protein